MAYINFNEEKIVSTEQLNKRNANNEKLRIEIINNKSKVPSLNGNKYSFRVLNNSTINNSIIQGVDDFIEIKDESFICSKFINCKFYNIKFLRCNFIGCEFIKCDFTGGGVIFDNCNFLMETIKKKPSLNKKDNLSCIFKYSTLYSKFVNSNLSYCIFD